MKQLFEDDNMKVTFGNSSITTIQSSQKNPNSGHVDDGTTRLEDAYLPNLSSQSNQGSQKISVEDTILTSVEEECDDHEVCEKV